MTIKRYVPRRDKYLYVGYWRGQVVDLADIPHFHRLVERITQIEPNLTLHIDMEDGTVQTCPTGSYVCWSEDTGFVVLDGTELQDRYEPSVEAIDVERT